MGNCKSCEQEGIIEYFGLHDTGLMSLAAMYKVITGRSDYYDKHNIPRETTHTVLFTDPVSNGRGRKLYDLIKTLDIGSVNVSEVRTNPNSKNPLEIFLFCPHWGKFQEWYEKNRSVIDDWNNKNAHDRFMVIEYRHNL